MLFNKIRKVQFRALLLIANDKITVFHVSKVNELLIQSNETFSLKISDRAPVLG